MNKFIKEVMPLPINYQGKRQAGFTLVELAVVVVIIGILATMGISTLSVQLAHTAISDTKNKQEIIKDALISYLGRNKRLPCPAVNILGGLDISARSAGAPPNCTTGFGLVPYSELGLPKSVAMDGWNNFFTYAVSPQWTATLNMTVTPGGYTTDNPAQGFNVGNYGTITVNTRIPASQNPPTQMTNATSKAVVALISYGINGSGAYGSKGTQKIAPVGADEVSNAIAQTALPLSALSLTTLFQREFADKDAGYGVFDDVVLWLSPDDLLRPIIKDGAIKSPEAQWVEQSTNIKNSIIAQILSDVDCSVNLSITPQNDPWGNAVTLNTTTPTAFSISSAATLYTISVELPNPDAATIIGPTAGLLAAIYPILSTKCP